MDHNTKMKRNAAHRRFNRPKKDEQRRRLSEKPTVCSPVYKDDIAASTVDYPRTILSHFVRRFFDVPSETHIYEGFLGNTLVCVRTLKKWSEAGEARLVDKMNGDVMQYYNVNKNSVWMFKQRKMAAQLSMAKRKVKMKW